jgi:hypothetical protein
MWGLFSRSTILSLFGKGYSCPAQSIDSDNQGEVTAAKVSGEVGLVEGEYMMFISAY